MAVYPGAILNITNPTGANYLDTAGVVHSVQHSTINDEVEAIEGELGINPRGTYASVLARLNDGVYLTGTQTITGAKTFSGSLFVGSTNADINLTGGAGNHAIEIGRRDGSASTPFIDFHSGATAVDYDARIIAGNGTGTQGQAVLSINAGQVLIPSIVPSTASLIVRGATAQTAPIQEWQNISGTIVASVESDGHLRAPGLSAIGGTGPYITTDNTSVIALNRTTVGNVVLRVRGMASQTGNLQQWEDSAAAAVAHVDTAGAFRGSALAKITNAGPYLNLDSDAIRIHNRTAVANVPLVVRGMAAQTGDLQQWQDSSGVNQATLAADGAFKSWSVQDLSGLGPYINLQSASVVVTGRGSNNNVTMRVRAHATQTAHLLQAETSTATMLMRIGIAGDIVTRASDGFRIAPTGGYGVLFRNDGTNMHILLTNAADPDGTYNALRPFYIVLSTGRVKMENGADVTGTITSTSTLSGTGLAGSLLSTFTPLVDATSAVIGTSAIPSRQDHVHPRSSSLVTLTDSQTLTNKILTSPTINSPTFGGTAGGLQTVGLGVYPAGGEIILGYNGSGGLSIAQGNTSTHGNGVVLWVSGNSLYARHANGADGFVN